MEEIMSGVDAVDKLIDELYEAIETTYVRDWYRSDALCITIDVRRALRLALAK